MEPPFIRPSIEFSYFDSSSKNTRYRNLSIRPSIERWWWIKGNKQHDECFRLPFAHKMSKNGRKYHRNSRCEQAPAFAQNANTRSNIASMPDPRKNKCCSKTELQRSLATSLRPCVLDRTHDTIGQHITLRHKTSLPEKDISATVQMYASTANGKRQTANVRFLLTFSQNNW